MSIQFVDLFFNTGNFVLKKPIGTGSFANVYVAEDSSSGELFAAKIYKETDEYSQKIFNRAAVASNSLNHPLILKFYGINYHSFEDTSRLQPTILLELCQKGSLGSFLAKENKGVPDENWTPTKKYIILLGIAHAMKYMHDRGIIHRDLKPYNILIDDNYHPKIGGFSMCKIFPHPLTISAEYEMTSNVGTPLYMAPEIFGDKDQYGCGVDVYSFSILAYEVVTGKLPYSMEKMSAYKLYRSVASGLRPELTGEITKPMKDLLCRCWSEDIDQRPSFDDIFKMLSKDPKLYFKEDLNEEEIHDFIQFLNDSQ
ncbi:hypothetical protein M9Y10_029803 [Tritrichomonas musculus]|uniref:Protein kinase domain-containing protein n=1 Tax=Tritrichomonas musculus TaxID=1915356 RepID=A0ABR2KP73_9EUKA